MAVTYESIATQTLGSAAASITFSSIAASWTDLRVVFVGTGSSDLYMRFNGDSGANYSGTGLYAWETFLPITSGRLTGARAIDQDYFGAGLSGTVPQFYFYDIFSYAGSTYKTTLGSISADRNGTGVASRSVWLWRNTAAITSVVLSTVGTFNTGTTATLYGIKNA